MASDNARKFASLVTAGAKSSALRCVTFSSPASDTEASKIRGELRTVSGNVVLQLEYFLTEGRLKHENKALCDVESTVCALIDAGYRRAELHAGDSAASLMISKKGKETLLCPKALTDALASGGSEPVRGNDREKEYIVPESAPFLAVLGVSDKTGRVHDKKRAKYRQINRFSEYAVDMLSSLKLGDTVKIADMCCGKSYLSFALYYVVTETLGKKCEMLCVDLKKSVIDDVSAAAEECGFDGMTFVCADINGYEPPFVPDMVVSLHACDVATDMVLDFAVRSKARSVLSTPCCHHELFNNLESPVLGFIAEHSVLKQKLCAAATDALRALYLRSEGYRVDVVEFIDPEDTPKNVMLRAKLTSSPESPKALAAKREYNEAYRFLTGKEK